ncbi:hypothetical protein [Streptomyces sp. NPDC059814]
MDTPESRLRNTTAPTVAKRSKRDVIKGVLPTASQMEVGAK